MPDIGDCVLCGAVGVELHREDSIPLWTWSYLGGPRDVWRVTRDGVETWLLPKFLVDTCGPCNWTMNRLYEDRDIARRTLPPLLVGRHVTLNGNEQRFVAAWLTKTSLMIRAAVPHDARPALLRHFHMSGFRLPGAIVWIAKYEPAVVVPPYTPLNSGSPQHPPEFRMPLDEAATPQGTPIGNPPVPFPYLVDNEPLAYAEATRIGALVLYVVHQARGLPPAFYDALDRMMLRLPVPGRIAWADIPAVTAQGYADIVSSVAWSGPGPT